MIRISPKINGRSSKKIAALWKTSCSKSTLASGGKGGATKGIIAVAGAASVFSGVLGYSAWSNENRKLVEENIPGASYVLEPFLGPLIVSAPVVTPKPNPDPGLLKKKLEREKALIDKESQSKQKTTSTITPLPTVAPPIPVLEETKKDTKTEEKTADASTDLEVRLASNAATDKKENAALVQQLHEAVKDAQNEVTVALGAAKTAAAAVRKHAEKAYAAIDSGEGHESLYAVAAEVAKAKKELIKVAEDKLTVAKEKILKLQNQILDGRDSKFTKNNTLLSAAEEALSELNYAVSKIHTLVAEGLRDSSAVSEFRDLVEAGYKQFEAEVRSLLPDVKIGEKSEKLTQDELNLLLAHAHRKVLTLQKALAKQQTVDKERFKDSVLRHREQETLLLDGKLHTELERQRRDLGLEHRHRLAQLREDMETELRSQLKRQAAAHSDHLADVLHIQEMELERKWENKMLDELQTETDRYHKALSSLQGDLNGLKTAIKSRADVDKAAYAAHELWLACESLRTALRLGKENAHSWEEQLLPLDGQVGSIKKAAGEKDPFVVAVLASLPNEAISRGVYTEDALRERFLKVDRVCRRVALVGENGGSLIRYFLSYVQSFFLLNAFEQIPGNEIRDEGVDVEKFDTHDILARTRYCLAKDDLLQAVRYINLLRGEPRHVASDWLKEARLALEAKQAADALMAHAAATGAKAL